MKYTFKKYRLFILHILCYMLSGSICLNAQSKRLKITTYTEADGLSSSIIRCVLQDSRGMLWVGTPDGLNTFDGINFNTLRKSTTNENSIKGNFVTKLAEDKVGDIWIGFINDGISRYNIATGKFDHFALNTPNEIIKTKAGEVTSLYIDAKNEVWIGIKQKGIFKLDKHSGKHERFNLLFDNLTVMNDLHNTVYDIYEDEPGVFWLATQAGLYYFVPSKNIMKPVRSEPLFGDTFNKELFMTISREKDYLWLGAWAGGIASYHIPSKQWKHYLFAPTASTNNIVTALQTQPNSDSIFIVTNDWGLGFFNKKNHQFTFTFSKEENKSGDYKSIFKDRANNIWVTSTKGLMKVWYQAQKFSFNEVPVKFSSNNGNHVISKIFETTDYTFMASWYADGLHVEDKKNKRNFVLPVESIPEEENNMLVNDVMQDSKGKIWIVSRDYIYHFDTKQNRLIKKHQPSLVPGHKKGNYFLGITEATDGNLWIATLRNGIFVYNSQLDKIVQHYTPDSSFTHIPTKAISVIHKDKNGRLWIGTRNGFLGRVHKSGKIETISTSLNSRAIVGVIHSISSTSNDVWIGTDVGLLQYHIKGVDIKPVKIYTAEDGISSDIVKFVYADSQDQIWCITQTALCKLNPARSLISNYGWDDGLEQSSIGNNITELANGQMVIGAIGGYYQFNPAALNKPDLTAPIVITSFTVKGLPRFYGTDLGIHHKIMLEPSENIFSFEFASINFNRTGKQRYAYMLEGFDKDWVHTYNRYAGYANLAPGNYVFKVRAIGNAGQDDSAVIALPILVTGYFYNTNTFRIAVVLAILAIMYMVYAIRLRNQKRLFMLKTKASLLEKEKAMIMYENLKQQLNPHFLFNSLTSLSSLIRINQKLAGEFLDGLSKIYRYILNNRDKELVSLSDELQFSERYILLQKTRFENALQVKIDVPEAHRHMKIAPVTLQNLLENAIKHNIVTVEDPLVVNIYVEHNNLIVKNTLNKKHFVETSNRQGLASLKSLYQYLSGQQILIVETAESFSVKIPLL